MTEVPFWKLNSEKQLIKVPTKLLVEYVGARAKQTDFYISIHGYSVYAPPILKYAMEEFGYDSTYSGSKNIGWTLPENFN